MYLKKLTTSNVLSFISQLNILLKQDITIDNAIIFIEITNKNNKFIKELKELIIKGHSLSYAINKLKNYSKLFDPFLIETLKIGEKTASLKFSINYINTYLNSYSKIKNKIILCSIYPFIILLVLILFVFFIIFFLLPSLENFYLSTPNGIPENIIYLLKIKNNISTFLEKYFFINILFLLIIYINKKNLQKLISNDTKLLFIKYIGLIKYNTPLIGRLNKLLISYKFFNILYIILKTNLNILNIKNITNINNQFINIQINDFITSIENGNDLQKSLSKCEFIPKDILELLVIEQSSSNFKITLKKIIKIIKQKILNEIIFLQKTLEPLLTIFLTFIVSIIIYYLYIPLINFQNI